TSSSSQLSALGCASFFLQGRVYYTQRDIDELNMATLTIVELCKKMKRTLYSFPLAFCCIIDYTHFGITHPPIRANSGVRRAPSSFSGNLFIGTLFVLYYFWTPTLAATACTALLLRVLPTRSARVYGSRHVRIPFVRIGQILIGLTIVFIVAIVLAWLLGRLSSDTVANGAKLPIFTVPTGLYLIHLGRRQKASPFPDDLLGGSSEPIGALYLRSFLQE